MAKIREFLKGKKSYIMAGIAVVTALVAWSEGQIDLTALIASIWAAVQTAFLRAGIATEVKKQSE